MDGEVRTSDQSSCHHLVPVISCVIFSLLLSLLTPSPTFYFLAAHSSSRMQLLLFLSIGNQIWFNCVVSFSLLFFFYCLNSVLIA